MKQSILIFTFLVSSSAFAGWGGDLMCLKPIYSPTGPLALVADAKGRLQVERKKDGSYLAKFSLDDVRLFSNFGQNRGTLLKNQVFLGSVIEGNDHWVTLTTPTSKVKNPIQSIEFDLSTFQRGLTTITTKKGNIYRMDCFFRED